MSSFEPQAREMIESRLKARRHAPNIGEDRPWLNTKRPLHLKEDLAGKVVLLHFWTFSSILCQRRLHEIRTLEKRFRDRPFLVVGCHSARFDHEKEPAAVRQAVLRLDVRHPVVIDRDFEIWNGYGVQVWPTLVLLSPDGYRLAEIPGEGRFGLVEALVEESLRIYSARGALDDRPVPVSFEGRRTVARELCFPSEVLADRDGDRLFIADTGHHRIVITTRSGDFVRAIGSGAPGAEDGDAAEARFFHPRGMCLVDGRLFVADTGNHAIRVIDLERGTVSTLARGGPSGDPPAEGVPPLIAPYDLARYEDHLLVCAAGSHRIFRCSLEDGAVLPLAGEGAMLQRNGDFRTAAFAEPSGAAVIRDTLYVVDAESSALREVDLVRARVRTLAGGSSNPMDLCHFGDEDGLGAGRRFQHPTGIATDGRFLFVADTYNHKIKRVDPKSAAVTTCAGRGGIGDDDGAAEDAAFFEPSGIATDGDLLFVADTNNHRIRVIDLGSFAVSTVRLRGVPTPREAVLGRGSRSLDLDELPQLPNTAFPAAGPFRVPPGPAMLEVLIELPDGCAFLDGAPSQFRARRIEGAIDVERRSGPLDRRVTAIPLMVDGPGRVEVRGLYYFERPDGSCHVRSVLWKASLDIDPKGADELVLVDRVE